MNKILIILLAIVLVLGLMSCEEKKISPSDQDESKTDGEGAGGSGSESGGEGAGGTDSGGTDSDGSNAGGSESDGSGNVSESAESKKLFDYDNLPETRYEYATKELYQILECPSNAYAVLICISVGAPDDETLDEEARELAKRLVGKFDELKAESFYASHKGEKYDKIYRYLYIPFDPELSDKIAAEWDEIASNGDKMYWVPTYYKKVEGPVLIFANEQIAEDDAVAYIERAWPANSLPLGKELLEKRPIHTGSDYLGKGFYDFVWVVSVEDLDLEGFTNPWFEENK